MSNNQTVIDGFTNGEGVAFNAIAEFARSLCETLTDADIIEMFKQHIYMLGEDGDYNDIIEYATEAGMRIEKRYNVTDIEKYIDEEIDENINSESINVFDMGEYILVNYDTIDLD